MVQDRAMVRMADQ